MLGLLLGRSRDHHRRRLPAVGHGHGRTARLGEPPARLAGRAPATATPAWLLEALGVSLAAQAATLPLTLLHFERVSLVSPLANLLIAPLVAPSMLLTVIALARSARLVGAGRAGAALRAADASPARWASARWSRSRTSAPACPSRRSTSRRRSIYVAQRPAAAVVAGSRAAQAQAQRSPSATQPQPKQPRRPRPDHRVVVDRRAPARQPVRAAGRWSVAAGRMVGCT